MNDRSVSSFSVQCIIPQHVQQTVILSEGLLHPDLDYYCHGNKMEGYGHTTFVTINMISGNGKTEVQ